MAELHIGVLGPLAVTTAGRSVEVPGAKQGAVLAVLALEAGRSVPAERLVEIVWGEHAGDTADHTLQQHISTLRKLLEPDRAPRSAPAVLLTRRQGYELRAATDRVEFESRAAAGSRAVAAGDWAAALSELDAALACWRGDALVDVAVTPWFETAAASLEERRLLVVEQRGDVLLELGRDLELVPELESLLAAHPFREHVWAQLMVAHFRAGRQADALAAYRRARIVLAEELGLEPGHELRALEARILAQDPTLRFDTEAGDVSGSAVERTLRSTYRSGSSTRVGRVRLPDGQIVHLVEGSNLIGRLSSAHVRLTDSRVSRSHAELVVSGDRVVLRDLDSTNGTTLDGEPVDEVELLSPAVIGVGGVDLDFRR